MKENYFKRGISLITLVITIVVIIILTGAIVLSLTQNNPIDKANEAKVKSNLSTLKDEFNMYMLSNYTAAGMPSVPANADGSIDTSKIKSAVSLSAADYKIINGSIAYVGSDTNTQAWAKSVGLNATTGGATTLTFDNVAGANAPQIPAGTNINPINWNGNSPQIVSTSEKWYDYSNKQWANIMLADRSTPSTADGSMYVWIPRYAYKIIYTDVNNRSLGGSVDVQFLQGTTNLNKDGVDVTTLGYKVHPAFYFGGWTRYNNQAMTKIAGGKEVSGIWVSKFQASNSGGVRSVPGVQPWGNIDMSTMFSNCLNIDSNTSKYGWAATSTVDTHLTKNIEWGAVAYLAQSNYGKAAEIWINNTVENSSKGTTGLTGYAGASKDATWGYTSGLTSGYIPGQDVFPYYTSNGQQASTTGNTYGIYDTNGLYSEYVAAYFDYPGYRTYFGLLDDAGYDAYRDVYVNNLTGVKADNYAGLGSAGITAGTVYSYGDAVWETSSSGVGTNASWYGEDSNTPGYLSGSGASQIFMRGGYVQSSASSGPFSFDYSHVGIGSDFGGIPYSVFGFRSVFIVN